MQGDANFRKQIDDLTGLRVRNERGGMVPLGSIAEVRDVSGPVMIIRYNLYPAATINLEHRPGRQLRPGDRRHGETGSGGAAPGHADRSGPSWRCCSSRPASTAMFAFTLAVVLVFLVLAAQYESWSLPLAVILVVPMCLLARSSV